MPAQTKEIKRRIRSVQNTGQITKAMQLVAAVKMRKAQEATLATRAYSKKAWQLVHDISADVEPTAHPFFRPRTVKSACIIAMSADRGLSGSLNANVFKKFQEVADRYAENDVVIEVICIGKRIHSYCKREGYTVAGEFSGFDKQLKHADILPITDIAIGGFLQETYDEVVLVYTDFESTLVQHASERHLLPFRKDDAPGDLGKIGLGNSDDEDDEAQSVDSSEYKYEPRRTALLDAMLPRLTEMQMYQAVLEGIASEHSSRMVAMKNASENAAELKDDLVLQFNQARQAGITQEIAEISAGSAALE